MDIGLSNKPCERNSINFLHIPKCGGSTITNIIRKEYTREVNRVDGYNVFGSINENVEKARRVCNKNIDNILYIIGHYRYYDFEELVNSKSIFSTIILRNPVDRVISHFYYLKQNEDLKLNDMVTGMSFKEYLEHDYHGLVDTYNNFMTGFLSKQYDIYEAIHNLRQFNMVGILKDMDLFHKNLVGILGWQNTELEIKNENESRPEKKKISPEIIGMIRKRNQLDLKLYEEAVSLSKSAS